MFRLISSLVFGAARANNRAEQNQSPRQATFSDYRNTNDDDDEDFLEAIRVSKEEADQRENEKKGSLDQLPNLSKEEYEQIAQIQSEDIKNVVYDPKTLREILKELPGVDPNSKIFSEFYYPKS